MNSRRYVALALSSIAGAGALTLPYGWPLAPLALAFFFYDIRSATSRNDACVRGFIFGTVTGGAGIWWAWGALPFLWLGYTNPFDGAYVMFIIWGLVSLGLGVSISLYAGIVWMVRKSWAWPILIVMLWPVAEWGRMWCFALLAAGQNSLIGPHFSIAALGYSLGEHPALLTLADTGGVYSLSFIVAVLGVAGVYSYNAFKLRSWTIAQIPVLLCLCILALTYRTAHVEALARPLTAGVVHTVRHDAPKAPPSFEVILREGSTTPTTPDMLVFPEDLSIFVGLKLETIIEKITALQHDTLVVYPERETSVSGLYRSLVTLATNTDGVVASYQKQFLMPEGEYSPFLSQWIFRLIGDPRVEGYFGSVKRLQQGAGFKTIVFNDVKIGALMCSDGLSPYLYRHLGLSGATVLVNIGDQTWFNGSHLLYQRLLLIAKVHAVQNRAYVIVANRGSPSFVIDPYGTTLAESAWNTEGIVYATIH